VYVHVHVYCGQKFVSSTLVFFYCFSTPMI
jgi:hypothetical protein